jgi:hypothetical protein
MITSTSLNVQKYQHKLFDKSLRIEMKSHSGFLRAEKNEQMPVQEYLTEHMHSDG